jgi:type I restriction enzyme, S subunit
MSEVTNVPKLRFPEFSEEWKVKRLNDLAKLITKQTGFDYSSRIKPSLEKLRDCNNVPFIQNKDFNSSSVNLNTDFFIPKSVQQKFPRITLDEKSMLITISGKIGNVGVYDKKEIAFIGGAVGIVKFKDDYKKSIDFIKYYLITTIGQKLITREVKASSHQNITVEGIRDFKIKLPPKPEQQKIALFLTSVDSKIEQLSKKLELLEKYKKGLMQKIFSQEIRFKADDGSHYPDWSLKKIGDISECLDNQRRPLNEAERNQMKGDIPYYGANGVVDYVNDYIFDDELVLLAEDGGKFDDFSSKPIAQKIAGKAWVNNHAHILKAKSSISINYLFYSLVNKDIRRYIVGGGRSKLNKTDLISIKIFLPPLNEQNKIANFLSSIDSKIEQIVKQLDETKQFKKALLQQMFV